MRRRVRPLLGAGAARLAAAATAGLFALAQPPTGIWPLAFVCLVPLLAALVGRDAVARARLGALAGALAAAFVALGPAAAGAATFFERPLWQGWLLATGVGEVFGIVGFTTFALLAGDPCRGAAPLASLRAGLAFAAAEFVRATLFGGLPWLLLAHALAPVPALLALAPYGGVTLLSLWIATIAAGLLRAAIGPDRRRAGIVVATAIGVALAAACSMPQRADDGADLAPGSVRVVASAAAPGTARRIALVQPGLPMAQWADPVRAAETVAHLTALSLARPSFAVDLLVWPENAVQALLPANESLVQRALAALAGRSDALLLGAPRYAIDAPTRRYNAALLYRGVGPPVAIHDKVKLLPLFETAPAWLAPFRAAGADLSAGAQPIVLPVRDDLRVGALLCYEVLFPSIARSEVRDGASVLVNLSNDAWFSGSGGAEQHFAAAVVLAATMQRPLLRATPTGVTAAIDAAGRVVARLPADRADVLVVDVAPAFAMAPAVRLGAAPDVAALALACAWTAIVAVRRDSARP